MSMKFGVIAILCGTIAFMGVAWATSTDMPLTAAQRNAALYKSSVTAEQADVFYKQCRDNQMTLQQLNPDQRELLCSCVSAGMQAEMKVGDLVAMQDVKSVAGNKSLVKMMEKVYFPCALPPLHDNIKQECLTRANGNPDFAATASGKCTCVSDKMTSYIQKVGIPETLYQMSVRADVKEPLDALTNGGGYSQEQVRTYYSCFGDQLP